MAVPTFLSIPYRFLKVYNVLDVSTILSNLVSELTALGWTINGGTYTSPVDAGGRSFKVITTRTGATVGTLETFNQNNVSLATFGMPLVGSTGVPNTVHIFTSAYYIHIECWGGGTPSYNSAGILDPSPEGLTAHTNYVYCSGSTWTNGSTANGTIAIAYMRDNTSVNSDSRMISFLLAGGGASPRYTLSGNLIYRPKEMNASTASLTYAFCGRCYQHILVPNIYAPGAIVQLPIDSNTLGSFFVSGAPSVASFNQAIRVG